MPPTYFDLKKMAPNVCTITWRPFFGGQPKNGYHKKLIAQKVTLNFFGQVWENLGKNLRTPKNLPAHTPMTQADLKECTSRPIRQININSKL